MCRSPGEPECEGADRALRLVVSSRAVSERGVSDKKAIIQALELVADGDVPTAQSLLAGVSAGFVRKRLDHYLRHGEKRRQRPAAERLWKELFPHPEHAVDGASRPPEVRPTTALPPQSPPRRVSIADPEPLLAWLTSPNEEVLTIDQLDFIQVWGLVALAALSLPERKSSPLLTSVGTGPVARFAHALGFDEVVRGRPVHARLEEGRTVRLQRVRRYSEIDGAAQEISRLLAPTEEQLELRKTIRYVLTELLRNVIQHSEDECGAVAAAQLNDIGPYSSAPAVQVAVADGGIGIPEHLSRMRKGLADPRAALERALWPHVSGAFPEGLTGTRDNAGLGLFFIAEMAKRARGRLLIASRGAALALEGTDEGEATRIKILPPPGLGFPGTLVTFEVTNDAIIDHDALLNAIRAAASTRTPGRAVHRWIRYEMPVGTATAIRVRDLREDTSRATALTEGSLRRAIFERKQVVFDFDGIEISTQSFLHALLYEVLRLAWATRTPVFVINTDDPVRSGLEFLESYALSG